MQRILFGFLDLMPLPQKIPLVLEGGSGTGYMAQELSARYGWRIVAADLAAEGLASTAHSPAVLPVQADICACPFASGVFDAVISLDVLVHLEAGKESVPLSEFARVLKPGGILILRVAALDILRSRHSEFVDEKQRFTRQRLMAAVTAAGFRVERCTFLNSLLLPVALFRFRIWEPLLNVQPTSGTAPISPLLNRLLSIPLRLEAAMVSRGWNLPLGQSLFLIASREQYSRDSK